VASTPIGYLQQKTPFLEKAAQNKAFWFSFRPRRQTFYKWRLSQKISFYLASRPESEIGSPHSGSFSPLHVANRATVYNQVSRNCGLEHVWPTPFI
jgi:hypothetical protein